MSVESPTIDPLVVQSIEKWRERLLDLSRRNPVLNFRPSRTSVARLVSPELPRLIESLVTQEKTLTFYLPDEEQPNLASSGDGPTEPEGGPSQAGSSADWRASVRDNSSDDADGMSGERSAPPPRPDEVRAEGDPKKLKSLLYRLRLRARSSLEEQGINTLYLATGMLEWTETATSQEIVQSPLLLVPVTLQRETALDPFRLALLRGDEIVPNPTLAEKLRRDFALELPTLDRQEEINLLQYLATVQAAVARQPGWNVTLDTYLGHFSFLKLAMYKDLEANAGLLAAHPVIQALAGVTGALPPGPADLPTERELDVKVPPKETFHFLDADASQLEAITAATRGADLIIQGPPGTGKSQTIANLIAEALAQNKKVLFVSEKMAALDVVSRRLAARGLDTLCLELHSHQANKRAVLDQLAKSLDAVDPGPPDVTQLLDLQQLALTRQRLNEYVDALHGSDNPLGISPFTAQVHVAALAAAPDATYRLVGVADLGHEQLAELLELIARLKVVGDVLLNQDSHPWRDSTVPEASLATQGIIGTRLKRLLDALERAHHIGGVIAGAWKLCAPTSVDEVRWLQQLLSLLESNPNPPVAWFAEGPLTPYLATAQAHAEEAADYRRRRTIVIARYAESVFDLPAANLRQALTTDAQEAVRPFSGSAAERRAAASAARIQLSTALDQAISAASALMAVGATLSPRFGLPDPVTGGDMQFLLQVMELLLKDPRPSPGWLNRSTVLAVQALAEQTLEQAKIRDEEGADLLARFDAGIIDAAPALEERYSRRYGNALRMLNSGYRRDRRLLRNLAKDGQAPDYRTALTVLNQALRVGKAHARFAENRADLTAHFGHHPAYVGAKTDWQALVDATETTRRIIDAFGERTVPRPVQDILARGGATVAEFSSAFKRLQGEWTTFTRTTDGLQQQADVADLIPAGCALRLAHDNLAAWRDQLRTFWAAEAAIRDLRRIDTPRTVDQLVDDITEVDALNGMIRRLLSESESLRQQFGSLFAGEATDWDGVLHALDWTQRVKGHFGATAPPDAFVARLSDPPQIASQEKTLLDAMLADITAGIDCVSNIFEPEAFRPAGQHADQSTFDDIGAWLRLRLDQLSGLEEWLDYRHARQNVEQAGLAAFLADLDQDRYPPNVWRDAFLKRFYQLWLDEQYGQIPALGLFRGARHQDIIAEFRKLDRASLGIAPRRVLHTVLGQRPPIGPAAAVTSEPAILYREISKRARHKPLRRLFHEIPTLLTTLKPCLLMSPLSVSQYLDPGRIRFDLVIFDEASQVLPEDAVGAIYRGSQLVVAGDGKQMPPSQFFQAGFDDVAEEAEADDAPELYESILDQCNSAGMRTTMLRWHYRSRDERLIAFSNHHFYDGRLITFPSPTGGDAECGVRFEATPDGVYDRGGSRTNRVEARRIADLVVAHAETRPAASVGVVAFSQAQMLAILDEIEMRRRHRPDLERFFREDGPEPFFVKNLETVQGDERDVIFFSVGYGKDRAGKMSASFGPLNRAGGERRLNVAVTRAREQVRFVSSVQPEDIDLSGTRSEGVRLLRRYMEFAIRGPSTLDAGPATSTGSAESPFEEAVAAELTKRGLVVHSQIGCAGFRIDLGVVHRDQPGRYVLGIECDGATYHSSKTARDRDRLRQEVLEGLGWRIHRIWSADWVRDRVREVQRTVDALEAAYRAADASAPIAPPPSEALGLEPLASPSDQPLQSPPSTPPLRTLPASEPAPRRAADQLTPYNEVQLPGRSDTDKFNTPSAAASTIPLLIARCVRAEGPVHVDRVIELIARSYGFQRTRERVAEQINRSIDRAVHQRKVVRRGEFLWPPGLLATEAPVRTSGPGGRPRAIDRIALEEIANALLLTLDECFSLPEETLIVQTARLLGYDRTGELVTARLKEAITDLEKAGNVIRNDVLVTKAASSEKHQYRAVGE